MTPSGADVGAGGASRFVPVPGMFNLRGLGGIPVTGGVTRHDVLIRSEAPVDIGPAGREALRDAGVRTVVDLREPIERTVAPLDLDLSQLEVHCTPVFGDTSVVARAAGPAALYCTVLDQRGSRLAAAIGALCDATTPAALVFCSAGKDRTGLVVALVLSALGAAEDDVVAEYRLTETVYHGEFRDRIVANARLVGLVPQRRVVSAAPTGGVMETVLGHLDRQHGGAVRYLLDHGVTVTQLDRLRDLLVEPRSDGRQPTRL